MEFTLSAPKELAERHMSETDIGKYRTEFMRDRDRILYSTAFRRLSGKTQVFLSGVDDHKRTRLTHTLEVSQIARTISKALKLDEDLTEAIALGHDIGHTPFGHAGERVLHEIMTLNKVHLIENCPFNNDGNDIEAIEALQGFKHNLNSLETTLSMEYYRDNEKGLNLTNFTLFGIKLHSNLEYKNKNGLDLKSLRYFSKWNSHCKFKESVNEAWSFEAFVVKEADEIAQRHHDIEDAIRGDIITKSEVVKIINEKFGEYFTDSERGMLVNLEKKSNERFISSISKIIVNLLVTRLVDNSCENLEIFKKTNNIKSNEDFAALMVQKNHNEVEKIISYGSIDGECKFKDSLKEFEDILSEIIISSYEVQKADAKGRYIIIKLFQAFFNNPQQLPNQCVVEFLLLVKKYKDDSLIRKEIEDYGMGHIRKIFKDYVTKMNDEKLLLEQVCMMRVICNYIGGMTDNYAIKMYKELY